MFYFMPLNSLSMRPVSTFIFNLLLLTTLFGCDIQYDTNIPNIPPEGRYVVITANQHSGQTMTQVAVALFDDASPINLVGGDVVQASTLDDSVLLLDSGAYTGSYVANLPNTANYNQIDFLMVHEPVKTRQNRWYPSDLLLTDPGPGELVGAAHH